MPATTFPLATVTTTAVNLRAEPHARSARLTTVAAGGGVEVGGNDADWLEVRHGSLTGFMFLPLVAGRRGDAPAWRTAVTTRSLNLRPTPGTDRPAVGAVPGGTVLDVLGWTGDWLEVRHGAGSAFVKAALTSSRGVLAEKAPPDEIVAQREAIAALADPVARGDAYEALQAKVEYRSQRDNLAQDPAGALIESESGRMCNLTALAMALQYVGVANPDPSRQYEDALEQLRQERGLPDRTLATGWGGVARALGAGVRFVKGGEFVEGRAWWEAAVRPELRRGHGVILSISGHIVRLQGLDDAGVVVDDPYGFSVLLPGTGRSFRGRNPYQSAQGPMLGADVRWPWADVAVHTMRWLAAIEPPRPFVPLGAPAPAPLPDLADDEPSDPSLEG